MTRSDEYAGVENFDARIERLTPVQQRAAHEAAHVVQQRRGVQLRDGVGQASDAYEQQADAVADAVVAGESAEALLNSSGPAASANQVQTLESNVPSPGAGGDQPGVTPSDALSLARKGRLGKLPHKAELEQRFQRNLDNLQAYFGAPARDACAMVQAEAFCVGNVLDGSASTTIRNGWELSSAERRWQIYDATDHRVYESFYTWPQPTLTIPKELITGGIAGGKDRPWSVWLKVTRTLVPFGDDDPTNFPHDYTTFEVYETQAERREAGREFDGDEEWDVRVPGLGPSQRSGVLAPGGTQVSPQVAMEILGNLSRGEPPFKPEMGKAGCSWFVSEGNPFVGIDLFRYGGKILIVVALAQDVCKVYTAQNRTKAVVTSVGGWVGASAAAAAFAAWWPPADVAGPWAWAGHGVGTLVSGGIGYWIGSQTMRTIYELVLE